MVQVPINILRTYRYKDYYIDICAQDEYEAWLYHKHYGIKMFMFGTFFGNATLDEFIEMVESNIDKYIEIFEDEER